MGCKSVILSAVTVEIHGEQQQNVFNLVPGLAWPSLSGYAAQNQMDEFVICTMFSPACNLLPCIVMLKSEMYPR